VVVQFHPVFHQWLNVKKRAVSQWQNFLVFTLIGRRHQRFLLRARIDCKFLHQLEAGPLLNCVAFVVGAGKLIRMYVLYGVYTRPFTNRYSLITKNWYYLGSR